MDKQKPVLRKKVLFDGKKMTNREMIDKLISEGFNTVERVDRRTVTNYYLKKGNIKYRFTTKTERDYIDQLLKGKKAELEHTETIKAIVKPNIKVEQAATMIASDHLTEEPDYYTKLERAKLNDGDILTGPSHENGGIPIKINNMVVAEAEGGEIVINKNSSKLFCEELSEINQAGGGKKLDCNVCEHKDTCNHMKNGGKISSDHANALEAIDNIINTHDINLCQQMLLELWNNSLITHFKSEEKLFTQSSDEVANDLLAQHKYFYSLIEKIKNKPTKQNIDAFCVSIKTHIWQEEKYFNNYPEKMGHVCPIDKAAKGTIINKRMKFPKTYKPQEGKYGTIKATKITDYEINKQIEAMIDTKGIDPNNYTGDEKNMLRQYSGYGGIQADEISLEEAKRSFTEYYTPDNIVRKMWALAYKYGFKDGHSVLEPSVGTGQFIKYVPAASMATGYEINKYSYSICKVLYPQYNFYLQPFESVFIKNRESLKNKITELTKYDLVIGNPPYGDVSGLGMGMGEKQYTTAKNWIEYFIMRGLDLLNQSGLLIYIIGTEVQNGGIPFLQQGSSKIKEMIAQRADILDAYRLPNGVFERTDVLTDILVFKRK